MYNKISLNCIFSLTYNILLTMFYTLLHLFSSETYIQRLFNSPPNYDSTSINITIYPPFQSTCQKQIR